LWKEYKYCQKDLYISSVAHLQAVFLWREVARKPNQRKGKNPKLLFSPEFLVAARLPWRAESSQIGFGNRDKRIEKTMP